MPLLVGATTLAAVLAVVGFFWHRYQASRVYIAMKERAVALEGEQQWARAADYWQRYLWLEPDDFVARMKFVEARQHLADEGLDRYTFTRILRETIGRASAEHKEELPGLRVQLAKNVFELGNYSDAWDIANELLDPKSDQAVAKTSPEALGMRRVLALSGCVLARGELRLDSEDRKRLEVDHDDPAKRLAAFRLMKYDPQSAADALTSALQDNPGDLMVAAWGANHFRRFADILAGGTSAAAARADAIMDELVTARPNDPDALIARYRYRLQLFGPDKVDQTDLQTALEVNPNHYDALLLMAESIAGSDPDQERRHLKQAVSTNSADSRAYLALAQLDVREGDFDAAIATLQEAKRAIGPQDQTISGLLAALLIERGDIEDARKTVDELESAMQTQLSRLNLSGRRSFQDRLNLLRAQLEIAAGNLRLAVRALRDVVAASSQANGGQVTPESVEARRVLGRLMERLGYWDLAAAYWLDVSGPPPAPTRDLSPRDESLYRDAVIAAAQAARRAATAYLALTQFDLAIQLLERYLDPTAYASLANSWSPEPEAWVQLVQAHLQQQLSLMPDDRNWTKFDEVFATASRLNPGRWELCVIQFERQIARPTDDATDMAKQVLSAGETEFRKNSEFWRSAALGYQRIGAAEAANHAMDQFDAVEPDVARRAVLRAVHAARGGDHATAEKILTDALPLVDRQGKIALRCMQVELRMASGATEEGMELAAKLVAAAPDERRVLILGIETALRVRKFGAAQKWEQALAAQDPADEFTPRWYRARRLIEQYAQLSAEERDQLEDLIASLRTMRPNLGDAVALSAQFADLRENRPQAIELYERAIASGVRSTGVIERLVTLLYAEGRAQEANAYFARLSAKEASTSGIDSLRIADAVGRNELDEAAKLAQKGVEDNPKDPIRRLWLAGVLARNREDEAAEKTLREAMAKFPDDVRVWNALFLFLQQSSRLDDAKSLLAEFVVQTGARDWSRHVIAAQAYQLLGNYQQALAEAELAVSIEPSKISSRMLLANMLMTVDVGRAREVLEEIHKVDGANRDARRILATLLAASGEENDWRRATELLDASDEEGNSPDRLIDNRVRAALLCRQGRNRAARAQNLAAARKLMADQVEAAGSGAVTFDRLFLAKLYEQEAWLLGDLSLLQAAREQLQDVVSRPNVAIHDVREYADFLIRQLTRTKVPDSTDWVNLQAVLQDDAVRFADECASRVAEFEAGPDRAASMTDVLQLVGCRVRLLHAAGQSEAAAQAIAALRAEQLPGIETMLGKPRAWFAVASLYSIVDDNSQAEDWYRRLIGVFPDGYLLLASELADQGRTEDAIDACLAAMPAGGEVPAKLAITLAQLLAADPDDASSMQRCEPIIARALELHRENVDLLVAAAVMNVTRNKNAEAINLFQRALELAPANALALNNLATLLAELPGQRAEALRLIKRAIATEGRKPALLDTLGTVEMRAGQIAQAIESLEEAVADGGGDARWYFHLAAAYQSAQNYEHAQDSLDEALRLGLEEQILTEGDQELLRELKRQLAPAAAEGRLESRAGDGPLDRTRAAVNSLQTKAA